MSTASLVIGVAAAETSRSGVLIAGVAGLVAGAMSMATGEYVSVHSQADSEKAALHQEKEELATDPEGEHRELMGIYMRRGLNQETAHLVATQLMAHDALDAHARDELGISETTTARPVQAAVVSALSFGVGAALPLAVVLLAPAEALLPAIVIAALLSLALLGAVAAKTGGASLWKGALRVSVWSSLAMGCTAAIGSFFGAAL